ncbi:MAG: tRNA (adenosine(37)-N6)-threonylcarbamoyltransferase complex transferase subunit TsaD [Candidatus Cloacimonetes bacterium]|nr:tRNA (adenosine(37)-N6)-threonylcarbamoyltransferase complex transferase subunit TsaD [Candidatus Cloacimonadota bacterium]
MTASENTFKILSFETSCDDTSTAVIDNNYHVLSNCISSQLVHEEFGGVVPELASRLHLKNIMWLTRLALKKADTSLSEIQAIAVSINPGLIGSLLVGVSFAKSLAYATQKPLIAINHMVGHLYAIKLDYPDLEPPYLALVASGGHTELVYFSARQKYEIIGRTRDDAAGEAFDKAAKLLGLGYPGGPLIDKLARQGNRKYIAFPRGLDRKGDFDFSYSGLKTSIRTYLLKTPQEVVQTHQADIAASVQAAIVDIMVKKAVNYAVSKQVSRIVVAGGVAANSYLRQSLSSQGSRRGIEVYFPSIGYCMDNAAMIGAAAIDKFIRQEFSGLELNAFSTKGLRFV